MPTRGRDRAAGSSKLELRRWESRYLFIVLYVFLEHHLSRGDYRRPGSTQRVRRMQRRRHELQLGLATPTDDYDLPVQHPHRA